MVLEKGKEGMSAKRAVLTVAILTVAMTCGCRIATDEHGDNKNVKVATPFGGVEVKTNDRDSITGLGLPVYPGAELVKKDKNNGSADVNLSFGRFQLRVKAASYRTPDTPEKVADFYRNAMKRYGTVIECNHDKPVGTPTQTDQGLTCSDGDGNGKHAEANADASGKREFKAGSKQHQHIVAIDPENSGTKFGLVVLDLPGNLSVGGSDPDERQ
ncbi:hypothetical protein [Edaphobacter modestus]|uniref:Uncharacterized protein n=1 Tax=Edaphobacter modestus TaxID=388466 RepID=A0A4Q7YUQ4_9BACT|nr:hypothetical protein [Edaphobacter modestus]RZU41044.1 hypothetical protein BDD14_2536 [Edaphobacter modestus]